MNSESALDKFAARVSQADATRNGAIVFRLTGAGGGEYCLDCSRGVAKITKEIPSRSPLIELIGDAPRIFAILEGKKDARAQFFAGGFRVRGDLRYASDLALELGIIEKPL